MGAAIPARVAYERDRVSGQELSALEERKHADSASPAKAKEPNAAHAIYQQKRLILTGPSHARWRQATPKQKQVSKERNHLNIQSMVSASILQSTNACHIYSGH